MASTLQLPKGRQKIELKIISADTITHISNAITWLQTYHSVVVAGGRLRDGRFGFGSAVMLTSKRTQQQEVVYARSRLIYTRT